MISDWTRLANEIVGGGRGCDRVADLLAAHGVSVVFGLPADSINSLFDAVRRHRSLRTVTCRHEGGAALMASAYGKLTGRPAAVTATNGPGVTHLPIGARDAWLDGAPMVLLPGAVPHASLGMRSFQDVDGQRLLAPWTDGSWRGESASGLERLGPLLARARQARRPVAFALASDTLMRPLRSRAPVARPAEPAGAWTTSEASVAAATERVRAARAIAVVVGDVRNAPQDVAGSARDIGLLAPSGIQASGWEEVPASRRLVPGSPGWDGVRSADVVVVVGDWPAEVMDGLAPVHTVHLTNEPSWRVDDTAYTALCGESGRTVWSQVATRVATEPQASTGHPSPWGADALAALGEALPTDATVCLEPGLVLAAGVVGLREADRRFTASFAAGTVGYAIPAALAGALSRPGALSVAVVDAPGWVEGQAEILSARKHGLDVAVVLLASGPAEVARLTSQAESLGMTVRTTQDAVMGSPWRADDAVILDAGARPGPASPPAQNEDTTRVVADSSASPESYRYIEGLGMTAVAAAKSGADPVCLDVRDEGALLRCLNPLYDAAFDRAPLVLVTRDDGRGRPADRSIPGVAAMTLIGDAADADDLIGRARLAAERAGGVVHVRLLTGGEHSPTMVVAEHRTGFVLHRPLPAPADLDRVAALLDGATDPVVLVGGGGSTAVDGAARLAARLGAPLLATMAGAACDHLAPFGGYVGSSGHTAANQALRAADVVLSLGVSARGAAFELFGPDSVVVDIDVDLETLVTRRGSALSLQADAAAVVTGLEERLGQGDPREHAVAVGHAAWWNSAGSRPTLHGRLRPSYVVRQTDRIAARHEPVGFTADVGINTLWLLRFRRSHARTVWTRNFATMGFALPAAVARAGRTGEPTVAVTGDGGMAMAMAGLHPCPGDDVPVLCVVLDNAGLAAIRYEQEIYGWPEYESGFANPDFAAVGRAHGWHGRTARTAEDLDAALEEFFASPRPTVLNVLCTKDEPPMPALVPDKARVASATFAWARQGKRGLRSATTAVNGLLGR